MSRRRLRIARITPQELMDKLTAGENISIVDLRQPMDIEAFPQMIPGGAAAASQRNHQGPPARRRDRLLASAQSPVRYRKPRQETRCPLREGLRYRLLPRDRKS